MNQSLKYTSLIEKNWYLTYTEYGGADVSQPLPASAFTMDAQVPGDIHLDLVRHGVLPGLYKDMNLDHARWTELKDWWYRTEFSAQEISVGSRAFLIFHGLDCFATIWLNGAIIGKTDNMFIRHEFDAGRQLKKRNELVVRLAAPAYEICVDTKHKNLLWTPERLFCRKPSMSFGWDIAPRMVTCGIWRPVELVVCPKARITDTWLRQLEVNKKKAIIDVIIEHQWVGNGKQAKLDIKIGCVQKTVTIKPKEGVKKISCRIEILNPRLWWPLGYGKPELYDVSVTLCSGKQPLDKKTLKIGLRSLELVQEKQKSGATSFMFRCNGQDIFITGLNWTPLDAIFGSIKNSETTRTLEKLEGVGCTMLRVWGGGIYENDHFYSECDRLGILVWHDFMMGCGWYPQTSKFAQKIDVEARTILKDLRNHACIALWTGDNENDEFWPHLVFKNTLTRKIIQAACDELVPGTPYLPSSPTTPSNPKNPDCWTEGDLHYYNHGSHYKDPANWNIRCRFMSEFGHLSLPSLTTIKKYFSQGREWPLDTFEWKYHGANTTRVARFRGPEKILDSLRACGKPLPRTIDQAVAWSQALQAEALCAWIRRYCEDPEFSGFLIWNVRDNWPQMSDAVIDYEGRPKQVFTRLKGLFRDMKKQWGKNHLSRGNTPCVS
ncbi:MAG: hypothetical protein A2268_04310 [Candidatus Raymondbacteria bacterium RifOxyA12_full_50_37]|uniref:beta-mannosidase n=1 Tax=Candidatus Raymondbacteria bacterium RIFOXYD12_FULL_49_13 TaxID=1817890 RepID=A0A1F7FBG7_UNCRA|nr:MAG: hypothetical protein A2268_04310 [Candidatus Raymondbacteria bacterium RifOxyA12_full_50_37]OGJ92266.1 MAG: hypothetical protein A2350_14765 [Candidatus Raymondbacteria bacterium RifOxyB12_full_50_8]OGJ92553.1 MAG: hypothetical protein A2248_05640 [Candidatus Raymondbacteria bacterium RIFOXYA2_FULL_49_16]OGJ97907.1 MAG: hypothetical protein A2453_02665 [Candidatus Raymondbacteria bacterium RIFOXYC2_FULL_50_21]OGK03978.1 MAG: hypothetical protein A2519_04620 [Candidatus Raymondbacteria b